MATYVLKRKQYKKYQNWAQPKLTANGTMGGNSFAVQASTSESSYPAYKAFDGNTAATARWGATSSSVPQWIHWYNPTPLKITKITVRNRPDYSDHITAGRVEGSHDGLTWTTIKTFTNSNGTLGGTWSIDLSNNKTFYKYYSIYITGYDSTNRTFVGINEITITAKTSTIVDGTSTDYDFITDKNYALKRRGTKKVRNVTLKGAIRCNHYDTLFGFSSSNYAITPNTFKAPTKNLEIYITGRSPTSLSGTHVWAFCYTSWAIQFDGTSLSFWTGNGSTFTKRITGGSFSANTAYNVKVTWNGSVYTLMYKLNTATTWTTIGTYSSTTPLPAGSTIALGLNHQSFSYPHTSNIWLNECHIDIDDSRWWTGRKDIQIDNQYELRR